MEKEKSIRILLVDDQKDFVETISFWLKSKGYSVLVCSNGEEVPGLIQAEPFDILFLDVQMPRVDGIETLKRIRQINQTLPIIMFTAHPENPALTEAHHYNIAGIFPKAGTFENLTGIMEVALRMQKRKS